MDAGKYRFFSDFERIKSKGCCIKYKIYNVTAFLVYMKINSKQKNPHSQDIMNWLEKCTSYTIQCDKMSKHIIVLAHFVLNNYSLYTITGTPAEIFS